MAARASSSGGHSVPRHPGSSPSSTNRAAAWAAAPPAGELTAVSIVAAPGRVDFVLQVTGNVQVNEFFLSEPDRLVLDLVGTKLSTGQIKLYDGVNRGGITNVRYAQYKPGTVRIVLDLESAKPYKVEQNGGEIRVSFGSSASFAASSAASLGWALAMSWE